MTMNQDGNASPGVDGMETGSTIDALVRHATRAPQSIAYLDEVGSVTFGALHAAARRGAAWLSHEGVRSGDTVAMALDSSPAGARRALELFYAAGWIGAVILPLFPDVPKAARIDLIKRYSANWLLASGAPPQVAQARSLDPLRFDPRDPGRDDLVPPRGDHPHAGFVYVFTSGTTGSSKTLLSTH
ncbi:MAG TPA: class I adenylate-forming enzyme family protein, partial [Burkholderiales bacterium]|nr:class I adenylate-forming enzyme family protein [Burkholderiales bacterium]